MTIQLFGMLMGPGLQAQSCQYHWWATVWFNTMLSQPTWWVGAPIRLQQCIALSTSTIGMPQHGLKSPAWVLLDVVSLFQTGRNPLLRSFPSSDFFLRNGSEQRAPCPYTWFGDLDMHNEGGIQSPEKSETWTCKRATKPDLRWVGEKEMELIAQVYFY